MIALSIHPLPRYGAPAQEHANDCTCIIAGVQKLKARGMQLVCSVYWVATCSRNSYKALSLMEPEEEPNLITNEHVLKDICLRTFEDERAASSSVRGRSSILSCISCRLAQLLMSRCFRATVCSLKLCAPSHQSVDDTLTCGLLLSKAWGIRQGQ